MSCPGNPGHGSRFIEGTAAEKLRSVINRFLDFRQQEKDRLEANPELTLGDVTSINLLNRPDDPVNDASQILAHASFLPVVLGIVTVALYLCADLNTTLLFNICLGGFYYFSVKQANNVHWDNYNRIK